MKSKKVVSLMLAAAMTAGLVTGCVKPTTGNAGSDVEQKDRKSTRLNSSH